MLNLKSLRKERRMTQTQAALLIGVSLVSFQNWERGITTPNAEHMEKLEEIFGKKLKADKQGLK